jgi:hypothetical protein
MNWLRSIRWKKSPSPLTILEDPASQVGEQPHQMDDDKLKLPDFDDLRKLEGLPQGCAWGVFDKDGKKDVFGTLNLLTPSVIRAAATEIQEGLSVSLK